MMPCRKFLYLLSQLGQPRHATAASFLRALNEYAFAFDDARFATRRLPPTGMPCRVKHREKRLKLITPPTHLH